MAIERTAVARRGRGYALAGGSIGLVIMGTVRFVTGSPWTVIHRLSAGDMLPPLWFLGLLWFGVPVLCGAAAGSLFAGLYHAAEREARFWRGCTALTLSLMCVAAWYALLFGKCSLLFSGLCLVAAALLTLICALSWRGLSVGATLLLLGAVFWYLVLLVLQLSVSLRA